MLASLEPIRQLKSNLLLPPCWVQVAVDEGVTAVKVAMEQENAPEDDSLEFREAAPSSAAIGGMLGTKNLLIIIITMPFVFLVVVMAIIALVGKPEKLSKADQSGVVRSVEATAVDAQTGLALGEPIEALEAGQRVVLPVPASVSSSLADLSAAIPLPLGSVPGAISLDGDRMALRVDGEDGGMIVIYDLATDRVVKTIPLVSVDGSTMSVLPVTNKSGGLLPLGELEKDVLDGGIPTPRLAVRRRKDN